MEEQSLYKKTLLTVAAMLGAWVLLVGSLSLVTLLVVGAATPSSDDSASAKSETAPGADRSTSKPHGAVPGHANHLMKSATQI